MQVLAATVEAVPNVETVFTKPASRFYRPELDVLRVLAFLAVFNHHLLPADFAATHFHGTYALGESGAAGVCLFFLLSSFLITELLLREKQQTGTIHIAAFYVRRILRIWPLYMLILVCAVVLPFALPLLHHPGPGVVVSFVLLAGNWSTVAYGWPHSALLGPLWSISVEEQFYLLWPLLVLRWGTKGIRRAACVVFPAAWAFDLVLPGLHISKQPGLWCNSVNQFQFFALGALLAVWTHDRQPAPAASTRPVLLAGGLSLLLLAAYPFHFLNPVGTTWPAQTLIAYLCLDGGTLLVFLAFLGARFPGRLKPLLYLGKISYGLYVFHLAVMFLVERILLPRLHLAAAIETTGKYALTLVLTIVAASLSYRFYEKPFLRFKDRFTFVASRPL